MSGVGAISGGVTGAATVAPCVGAASTQTASASSPVNSPAAVISISPQGFHTNFLSEVAAVDNSYKALSDQLVAAAVLSAINDNDDKEDKIGNIAAALLVATAIQAYNNISGMPGAQTTAAVPGAGVSISVSA